MNTKTKRVAVMCFSDDSGGMAMTAKRLTILLSRNYDVTFFCRKGAYAEKSIEASGSNVRCVPISFSSRTFSISMLVNVRKAISQEGIKNVIFLGASELKTLYFSFLGLNINLIVWHGTTKSSPKRDMLHRLVYSGVNYHVTISQHLMRNIQEIVPITKGVGFRLILPSQDIIASVEDLISNSEDAISILHIGRIAEGKGQLDAIRTAEILLEAGIDCTLTIIGEDSGDDYANNVSKAVGSSCYGGRINILGFVDDIYQYLNSADVFLFPSRGEGMPGSIIEALHFPLICLAYNNTVFPEFAEMGFHFHTVDDGDVGLLVKELKLICENLDEERKKANKNPDIARNIFNSDRELRDWSELLV